MAVEAEGLESPARGHGAGSRPGAFTARERGERRRWSIGVRLTLAGAGLAAAACLAVAAFVALTPSAPGSKPGLDRLAVAPEADETSPVRQPDAVPASHDSSSPRITNAAHAEPEEAFVFAIFRGTDGSCECVQVDEPEWSGEKRLAEVDRHELVRAAFKDPCTTLAPEVVVIGVAGRPGTIAPTRGHAEAIAQRLGRQALHGRDVSSAAYAAMPDLAPGTIVVAEKVSVAP